MSHTITLNDEQLIILRDILADRLEDISEEIAFFSENPEALNEAEEEDSEPLTLEDYEEYRDQVETLLEVLPEVEPA